MKKTLNKRERIRIVAESIPSSVSTTIGFYGFRMAGRAGDAAKSAAVRSTTRFGRAGTGVAIKALSGAAAHRATLARIGGGPKLMGGRGMAGGAATLKNLGIGATAIVGGAAVLIVVAGAVVEFRQEQCQDEPEGMDEPTA